MGVRVSVPARIWATRDAKLGYAFVDVGERAAGTRHLYATRMRICGPAFYHRGGLVSPIQPDQSISRRLKVASVAPAALADRDTVPHAWRP